MRLRKPAWACGMKSAKHAGLALGVRWMRPTVFVLLMPLCSLQANFTRGMQLALSHYPKGEIGKTKAPMWLLPSTALIETAWAQQDGATKYGAYNWRETKVCASTYISAMMRHWAAYLDGEDRATDSNCHHLAHIVANCNILMDAAKCGTLVDDRPKSP